METQTKESAGIQWSTFKHSLGPGLIMAAAAIGVSHLVQSTRAGANYGFALIGFVILANLFKYPFLEFGPRYAIATGESMIEGYKRLGKGAFGIFFLFTVGTMFAVQAAVTIVTASLFAQVTGWALHPVIWSAIILIICIAILLRGKYSALDGTIKLMMILLAGSTLIAVIAAFFQPQAMPQTQAPSIWTVGGVSFVIALMGWMPIPIDGAAWHSIWSLERTKQTQYRPKLKEALLDFNIGYIGAAVLAMLFLSLGALVMYGKDIAFASSGAAFARQLIEMYTDTLGGWSYWIIALAAITTMFSTTITVTDAYPRVMGRMILLFQQDPDSLTEDATKPILQRYYQLLLVGVSILSLVFMYLLGKNFTFLIDLATTLSFLTAPILAWLNYRLVTGKNMPESTQPKTWLKILSWAGILFLSLFALVYLYWILFQ
jgi:Mn2+/Fe2+ NRAMP family transporter